MRRMKHPKHGWTHAYNPNEEAYLRSIGWVEDTPEVKIEQPAVVVEQPKVVEEVRRGPGRPRKVA